MLQTLFRRDVATRRTPADQSRLALASLIRGAVDRFELGVKSGDTRQQAQALADLDAHRAEVQALKDRARTGLLYRCDECGEDFPPDEIAVGQHNVCQWCSL